MALFLQAAVFAVVHPTPEYTIYSLLEWVVATVKLAEQTI